MSQDRHPTSEDMSGRPSPHTDILARTERLLASDRLTEPTRRALQARLHHTFGPPCVLNEAQMATVRAAAARLIPSDLAEVVDLAGAFDAALARGDGDGWRYAELPSDLELHRQGLDALDAAARDQGRATFAQAPGEVQDTLLREACAGKLATPFDSALWFEELLAALVELHYAHPAVQVQIGYDGMADAGGWRDVGLAEVARHAEGER